MITGLYRDNTNKRLGVGTQVPNARLRVESDEQFTGVFASLHASDTIEVLRANYLHERAIGELRSEIEALKRR